MDPAFCCGGRQRSLGKRLLHLLPEQLCGRGEGTPFFPNHAEFRFQLRRHGAEAQRAFWGGVHPAADGEGVPHAGLHQEGSIIYQVERGGDAELRKSGAEPGLKFIVGLPPGDLLGDQQGLVEQVLPADGLFLGQGTVLAHEDPPSRPCGKTTHWRDCPCA